MLSPEELDRLNVVLVATRNPLNIGAVARAMSNFGFRRLRLVKPYELAYREARSAVGASEILASAEEYGSVADAVADCTLVLATTAARGREQRQPLRMLTAGAALIRSHMKSGRVAILFGSEKRGLANEDISYCHWLMRIPTSELNVSMNLGQAVAICLYEIARESNNIAAEDQRRQFEPAQPSTADKLERITSELFEILCASGYVNSAAAASSQQKLRCLVRRLNLRAADAETWLGMLRQIAWKLRLRSE